MIKDEEVRNMRESGTWEELEKEGRGRNYVSIVLIYEILKKF